jgi:hypothetical protein
MIPAHSIPRIFSSPLASVKRNRDRGSGWVTLSVLGGIESSVLANKSIDPQFRSTEGRSTISGSQSQ